MKKQKRQHKMKVFKLQATWEAQEKAQRVDLWRLLNDKGDHALIPMQMFKDIYAGDLMLAFRKHLIPPKQVFHLVCNIHARNDETGEEVHVTYENKLHQQITIWQFLEGTDDSFPDEVIYKDQGNGLKTRWDGFHKDLERYLDTVGDDDYRMLSNHCTLTVHTAFKSFWHEQQFYLAKGNGPKLLVNLKK